ncbi:phage terminase large subunit [Aestuariicoccus sp. MJ-SS9]|uniref:phage terminase large subunit n=1 Tax=Aestuariicoccus sp. MJ-SS9 TaxID=3079855 RepID=UPI0029079FF2|nr:phage terminase large subunit [Aestuariicoccus sp. MJ-SS9]MDU8912249.1 phage terminase large subunit [Aestuariicoccus sp. MJ-SS9]
MNELDDIAVLNALLRSDLSSFIQRSFATVAPGSAYLHNWHVDAIAHQLDRVVGGEITRLIITMPPRSLKSIAASVAFPAWLLGRNPKMRILAVSYAEGLSDRLALDCQKVIEAPWYRACFPGTRIARGRGGRADFETTRGGGRFSTSIGGTVTGRGGDIILLDDPHKPDEAASEAKRQQVIDWYRTTLLSRLNDPLSGAIVVIQQRVHEADLAGVLLEQGGWEHLDLQAISDAPVSIPLGSGRTIDRDEGHLLHPERLPRPLLERYRHELGSYAFSAQYQQRPAPIDGGLVKWSWFKTYDRTPDLRAGYQIVQSWDTASKADEANDYSVCTTWMVRGADAWLVDLFRARLEYPDLRRRIISEASRHKVATVLIEDAGSGTNLIQDLRRETRHNVIGIRPKNDKATRLLAVSPQIEAGRIAVPKDAPWIADFRRELTHFPKGKHDDQVDSLTQFLGWLATPRPTALMGRQE